MPEEVIISNTPESKTAEKVAKLVKSYQAATSSPDGVTAFILSPKEKTHPRTGVSIDTAGQEEIVPQPNGEVFVLLQAGDSVILDDWGDAETDKARRAVLLHVTATPGGVNVEYAYTTFYSRLSEVNPSGTRDLSITPDAIASFLATDSHVVYGSCSANPFEAGSRPILDELPTRTFGTLKDVQELDGKPQVIDRRGVFQPTTDVVVKGKLEKRPAALVFGLPDDVQTKIFGHGQDSIPLDIRRK